MAMADVDIFVGNTIMIDSDVYQLWLNGYSAQEASQIQQKRGLLQKFSATYDMLLSDTLDHYRAFSMMETLLKNPPRMADQCKFQIPPETQRMLIEKYYEFDQSVIRELLGKKLTSKMRGGLEDLSEKTHVPQRSCKRQFDNARHVFKVVEEMPGSLILNIKTNFRLPNYLAQHYAAVVFMSNHRFETNKKKLQYLNFNDFAHCASDMIENWSYSSKDCREHEDMDVDLDRDFLIGLRELKVLAERENLDEQRSITSRTIQGKLSSSAASDLESNFKSYAKTLVNIAYGLNHQKELRDFFIDLVEKFIEPCRNSGWTVMDAKEFLITYKNITPQMEFFKRSSPSLLRTWERYLATVTVCIIRMFHS